MHRPLRMWVGALAGALVLTSCGGEGDASEDVAPPSIPSGVAGALARASDEVAASLEAGDGCGAAEEAAELRDAALVAVEEGRVPGELAEPLLQAVERLEAQIVCVEAEEPAPPGEEKDEPPDKDEDKDKGKDKDKEKDEGDGDAEDLERSGEGDGR